MAESAAVGGEARGAVIPPRRNAHAANRPPAYPYASRLRHEQGRVTLRVTVEPDGRVSGILVLMSSGFRDLDEAAMTAVRHWTFDPAMQDGDPVFSTTTVGITFNLEGERRW